MERSCHAKEEQCTDPEVGKSLMDFKKEKTSVEERKERNYYGIGMIGRASCRSLSFVLNSTRSY